MGAGHCHAWKELQCMRIPRMYHNPSSHLALLLNLSGCAYKGAWAPTQTYPFLIHIPFQENLLIQPVHFIPSSRTNPIPSPNSMALHTSKPRSDLPLKQLGNGGSHLFRDRQYTLLSPFIIKPSWHLNSTISLKENKLLFSDTMTAFSTWGGVHLLSSMHWGGGPLQTPTWPSMLVQCKEGSPTRLKSFFPLASVLHW